MYCNWKTCESWCWLRTETPVNFKFLGPAKTIEWVENAVRKVIQNIDQRVKNFSAKIYVF